MSIKKKTQLFDVDMKKEIIETIKEKKIDLISVVLFIGLWIFGFIIYDTSLYTLFMIIFSIIYLIRFYYVSIKLETQNRIYYEILNKSEDFKIIADKIRSEKENDTEEN